MIGEITLQLRGEAGARQVKGRKGKGPKVGMTSNGGGLVDGGSGTQTVTILTV
jgi:hypothetical protein